MVCQFYFYHWLSYTLLFAIAKGSGNCCWRHLLIHNLFYSLLSCYLNVSSTNNVPFVLSILFILFLLLLLFFYLVPLYLFVVTVIKYYLILVILYYLPFLFHLDSPELKKTKKKSKERGVVGL